MAFRIWHGGTLVLLSDAAGNFGDFHAPAGFSDQKINGKPWRFFVLDDAGKDLRVEVSERYAIRYELIGQLIISLIAPAALFVPVIFIVVWFGVRRSLIPIERLSRAVDDRRPDDLVPIPPGDAPQEILPLIQAINRLFIRIAESFQREREFTDHAAHELRTPLAAMKTQAQVLMKKASNLPELAGGLENLNASIDRATHLVEQLLSLARLQHESLPFARVNLSSCLRVVIGEIAPISAAKAQKLTLSIVDDICVQGHEASLAILIRNILENAVKYTPDNGVIDVRLASNGALRIADTGPGLSEADKERAFKRFVRIDKTGQPGSGLGLSIAEWVATAHRARLRMEDNFPHGLTVVMEWEKGESG
ncbi:MAG: hypothetical protein HYU57_02870 [Micavibrio aeruginosavorus]|nr:hypothetical protein [Micavibrio aeruginosavorus]